MQTQLGPSLVATRGYGGPEVVTAYRRAQELSRQLGEPPRPPVLRALAIASIARANFDQAAHYGEQLLDMAARTSDPVLYVEGSYTVGVALFWKGDLTTSRAHLERALAQYSESFGTDHLNLFAQDPRVVCMSRLALDLWLLGDPQSANELMKRALDLAQELAHPNSLGYAYLFAMMLAYLERDVERVARHADACVVLSHEHAMNLWLSNGMIFRGWSAAERGDVAAGLAEIRRGIRLFRSGGNVYIMPFFLALLAEQSSRLRRVDRALAILSVALAAAERTGEQWFAAELHRVRGVILRALGDNHQAEAAFQQALSIAHAQQAKTLEARVVQEINRSECSD
jgi:predicted ATPase